MRPHNLTPQWYTSSSKTRPIPIRSYLLIVHLSLGAIFFIKPPQTHQVHVSSCFWTHASPVLLAWSTMMVLLTWPAWPFSYHGLGQGWCLGGFIRNTRVTRCHSCTWGGRTNLHCCNSYLEFLDPDVTLYGSWQYSAQSMSLRYEGNMILVCVWEDGRCSLCGCETTHRSKLFILWQWSYFS